MLLRDFHLRCRPRVGWVWGLLSALHLPLGMVSCLQGRSNPASFNRFSSDRAFTYNNQNKIGSFPPCCMQITQYVKDGPYFLCYSLTLFSVQLLCQREAWDMISIINYYNSPLSGEKNRSPGNSSPSSDLPEISICLLRRYKSLRPFIPLCRFRDLHTEQKCSLVTLEKQQRFNITHILSVRNSFSERRTHTWIRTFPK